jgi:hypothetical protein
MDQRFDLMDQRFQAVDQRFQDLEAKIDLRFDHVVQQLGRVDLDLRSLASEMKAGSAHVDERFEAMHRLLIQFCGLMMAALVGLFATQI